MISDATFDKFCTSFFFFFLFSNSFHFSLVAMMKEGRCSCEVLWLLLLISMYFTFFQLPQSLHSCKLSSPWLVHSVSIIETPQTTKSGRPGISANWSNALWGGGGDWTEGKLVWLLRKCDARRFFFFNFRTKKYRGHRGISTSTVSYQTCEMVMFTKFIFPLAYFMRDLQ